MSKHSVVISLVLMLVMVFLAGGNLAAQSVGSVLGNVNGDGAINIIDALLTAQYAAGISVASYNSQLADVDGNRAVTIIDALLIAQYTTGLITQFPALKHPVEAQFAVIRLPIIDETVLKTGVR